MQIQSPSFMYQTPQIYGLPQSTIATQQSGMTNQGLCGQQSQSNPMLNLLTSIIGRVLDFAFNLISQLSGQSQVAGQNSGFGLKSALAPVESSQTAATIASPAAESTSLWDMGKNMFDTVTSSLGITKLVGTVVDGAKNLFKGGIVGALTKVGTSIAGLF